MRHQLKVSKQQCSDDTYGRKLVGAVCCTLAMVVDYAASDYSGATRLSLRLAPMDFTTRIRGRMPSSIFIAKETSRTTVPTAVLAYYSQQQRSQQSSIFRNRLARFERLSKSSPRLAGHRLLQPTHELLVAEMPLEIQSTDTLTRLQSCYVPHPSIHWDIPLPAYSAYST